MPRARPIRVPAGFVAAAGLFAVSVTGWLVLRGSDVGIYGRQSDAQIYRAAGAAVRVADQLYPTRFGSAHLPFSYPPFAALLFAAPSALPFWMWQVGLAVATMLGLVVSSLAAMRLTGRPIVECPTPALVLAAISIWLEPVQSTLLFGQLNVLLMALVLSDLAFAGESRWAGVGIGLAAGLKLTPLIFVGYLLLLGRRRPAATSMLTVAATVVVGFAALPADALRYWTGRVVEPGDDPVRLVNQSLRGALLRVAGATAGQLAGWLTAALLIAVIGLAGAVRAARSGRALLGAVLCATTGLLVSPVSWSHHWVWVVAGLGLCWSIRSPWRELLGGAVLLLFAWWPLPVGPHGSWLAIDVHPSGWLRIAPHDDGREVHWSAWQSVYGNYYVEVAVLVVVAGLLLTLHRAVPAVELPTPATGTVPAQDARMG